MKQSVDLYVNSKSQQLALILEAFDDLNEERQTLTALHIGGLDRLLGK